ncbi:MAG: hypothetical protein ACI8S6_000319 [Myxococcota bacterium]|jgi:hypothetical protein
MNWKHISLIFGLLTIGCDSDKGATDADGDGFSSDEDCDDADAAISPDAEEVCDGVDNNCDDEIDNEAGDASDWFVDADADGYGDASDTTAACEAPTGYVDNADDCDDTDATLSPDTSWYADADSDGYGADDSSIVQCEEPSGHVMDATDCDDGNDTVYPSAAEGCDGIDHDCDGEIDNDFDGDGFSDDTCGGLDCDDSSADYAPDVAEGCDGTDHDCSGEIDNDVDGDGYSDEACGGLDCDDSDSALFPDSTGFCGYYDSCLSIYEAGAAAGDGTYTIDPDGLDNGEEAIEVRCDMDNGGWTLCASLSKGYLPADMLYNADLYAFQARLNSDNSYAFETEAPGRSKKTWATAEDLNYGQFCRLMDETDVIQTRIEARMWNVANDYGETLKGTTYDLEKSGTFEGNLYTQWFTNSSSARTFTHVSGDQLYIIDDDNGYGGPYTTPTVSWTSSGAGGLTQSTNPWGGVDSSVECSGCTYYGAGYDSLPYDKTTILNDLSDSFWKGIPNAEYGWSDCTADGNCTYHESGLGVWLFWVQ